jgi:uncharacterized protein YkwD
MAIMYLKGSTNQNAIGLAAMLCCSFATAAQADVRSGPELVGLINAYRAAPGRCGAAQASAAPPLTPHPALANVRIGTGTFLELALERAGYKAEHAEAIHVSGPADALEAMDAIRLPYCRTLLNPKFSAVGAARSGSSWQLVFAEPFVEAPPIVLPDLQESGRVILALVNAARAEGRSCGAKAYGAAPALAWNGQLAEAALAHSRDMAAKGYFSHTGRDASVAATRVARAGYRFLRVGENIAYGQESAQDVVAGWLASPGHCANIMNPAFTEMGSGFAAGVDGKKMRIYWTQEFGTPR